MREDAQQWGGEGTEAAPSDAALSKGDATIKGIRGFGGGLTASTETREEWKGR